MKISSFCKRILLWIQILFTGPRTSSGPRDAEPQNEGDPFTILSFLLFVGLESSCIIAGFWKPSRHSEVSDGKQTKKLKLKQRPSYDCWWYYVWIFILRHSLTLYNVC